jgi:hypothetical protein
MRIRSHKTGKFYAGVIDYDTLQEHAAEFWTAAPRCARSAAPGAPVGRRDGQTGRSAHWAPP